MATVTALILRFIACVILASFVATGLPGMCPQDITRACMILASDSSGILTVARTEYNLLLGSGMNGIGGNRRAMAYELEVSTANRDSILGTR